MIRDIRPAVLGYANGVPIFSLRGADGLDPVSTPDPAGQSAGGAPDSGQSAASDQGSGDTGQSADSVSREEFERIRAQLQAADQKRSEAEGKLRTLEDKDKSELERVQTKAQELEQSVQVLSEQNSQLRLENEFLKDSTYTWHNPADVLLFLKNDESVSIDDRGQVVGMSAALKKLATDKAYLVKTEKQQTPTVPSGGTVNSGKKSEPNSDDELYRKYPSLAGRRRK